MRNRRVKSRARNGMNNIKNLPVGNAHHLRSEDAGRLPLLLKEMLDRAEELFGAQDESFSVTGIAFWEGSPTIDFPKGYEGKEIDIWLQIILKDDMDFAMKRACYQLAHESVHLLSPVLREESTYFEEGVACYFSVHYMTAKLNQNESFWMNTGNPMYQSALNLVKCQLDSNKQGVRELRRGEDGWREFGDISKDELRQAFPDLTAEDAHLLTSLFLRDKG